MCFTVLSDIINKLKTQISKAKTIRTFDIYIISQGSTKQNPTFNNEGGVDIF